MESNSKIKCEHCENTLDIRIDYVYPTNFYNEKGEKVETAYSVYCNKCGKYTKASKEFVESFSRK